MGGLGTYHVTTELTILRLNHRLECKHVCTGIYVSNKEKNANEKSGSAFVCQCRRNAFTVSTRGTLG